MTSSLLLVGCGKMGGALLDGWLKAGTVERIAVVEPSGRVIDRANVEVYSDGGELPADFRPDVVAIAVKPQMIDAALPPYRRFVNPSTVFLSIAAGKTVTVLGRHLGEAAIVRAMPNTPAAIGRGITVAVANSRVSDAQREVCGGLLSAVGDVGWVEDEALIDAVTAVSGSGPAYVFLLVETMAAAGVALGLPQTLAMQLARATVAGSGELLHCLPETAAALRQAVTSPGGTTKAALDVLMGEGGLEPLMIKAIAAAERRSRELAG